MTLTKLLLGSEVSHLSFKHRVGISHVVFISCNIAMVQEMETDMENPSLGAVVRATCPVFFEISHLSLRPIVCSPEENLAKAMFS